MVSGTPEIRVTADWAAFREEWQTSMGAAATEKGITFSLEPADSTSQVDSAVVVRINVNFYRYVSQAKRYAVGVFSGNAFMDLDVEFIEIPSKRTLGSRKFATSSSAWQGVFSAMTPKQVEAVSGEMINEIAQR